MYECMDLFSEATNAWFKHAFNAPTEAQRLAWPAILHIEAHLMSEYADCTGSGTVFLVYALG